MIILRMTLPSLLLVLLCTGAALAQRQNPPLPDPTSEQIKNYWYPKGAELSRFELAQSRYGEIHRGDAVLVFVTESLNPALQVKAERPQSVSVPVLKLNATRKFFTGIYPYSVMTSVFAPIDTARYPLPLKLSFSSQEWCGHVYAQLNLRQGIYEGAQHSYFEKEADRQFSLDGILSEDALWTLIRISPSRLPLGRTRLLPGLFYSRVSHQPVAPEKATTELEPADSLSSEGNPLVAYIVRFERSRRVLKILFERDFPHRIQSWEDSSPTPARFGGQHLVTRAQRTHTLMIDYWNRHHNQDRRLLTKLGLASRAP